MTGCRNGPVPAPPALRRPRFAAAVRAKRFGPACRIRFAAPGTGRAPMAAPLGAYREPDARPCSRSADCASLANLRHAPPPSGLRHGKRPVANRRGTQFTLAWPERSVPAAVWLQPADRLGSRSGSGVPHSCGTRSWNGDRAIPVLPTAPPSPRDVRRPGPFKTLRSRLASPRERKNAQPSNR